MYMMMIKLQRDEITEFIKIRKERENNYFQVI